MELLKFQKDIVESENNLTIVCAERGAGTTTGLIERALYDARQGKFVLFIGNKREVSRYLENRKNIRHSVLSGVFSLKDIKGKIKCLGINDILESGKIPDLGYETIIVDRIDFLEKSHYSIKFFQNAIKYNWDLSLRNNSTDLVVSLDLGYNSIYTNPEYKDNYILNLENYPDANIIQADLKDNPYLDDIFKNVLDVTALKKKEEDLKRACNLVADMGDLMVDFLEATNGATEAGNKLKEAMDNLRDHYE